MEHDFSLVFETENPLWQRVLSIFEKNEKYEKKVVKNRNLHHKWPRSFSKLLGENVDNDKDNLISLSLADHFLIHYYYYLLAKKGFRQRMAVAFTFMAKKSLKYITPETAESIAKDYAEAKTIADQVVSETNKGQIPWNKDRKLSEEYKKKISETKKGKPMSEDWKNYMNDIRQTDEYKRKQSEAHKGKTLSDEHKRKISKSSKNKIFTDFGEKYLTHFGYSARENIKQYKKEYHFYKKYGFCSWESVIYNKEDNENE